MTDFAQRIQKAIKQSPELLIKLSQIDEFKGLWKGKLALSPQILNRLKQAIIITSTGASTRIEGSQMADKEIKKLLQGLKTTKLQDRDSQEVAGYAKLLKIIFDNWQKIKFSESTILHFHKILLQYSQKDQYHLGNYKKQPNTVIARDAHGQKTVIFNPTPPHLTQKEMHEAIDWTQKAFKNKKLHPLLVIGNFIYEFLTIHPFQDGNGRLSRILTNLLLLKSNYSYMPYASLEKIIEDNKSQYYLALRESQRYHKTKRENVSSWLNFHLDVLIKQTKIAQKLLKAKQTEALLSTRQQKILKLIRKHDNLQIKDVQKQTDISRASVKQILKRLLELKFIKKQGLGRATHYQLY